MSEGEPLEAGYLIEAYRVELAESVRTVVLLKAIIAQKDKELNELREKVYDNG